MSFLEKWWPLNRTGFRALVRRIKFWAQEQYRCDAAGDFLEFFKFSIFNTR